MDDDAAFCYKSPMENRILVIDDDHDYLEVLKLKLNDSGFPDVRIENDPVEALAHVAEAEPYDVALIDMNMPEMNGVEALEAIRHVSPTTECIMLTAVNEARVAVECLRKGAYDYLLKPIAIEDLTATIHRTLERKRLVEILYMEKRKTVPRLLHEKAFAPIITGSPKVLRVLKEAELHAASDVPVLITGESGTGKELLARAIHAASPRWEHPFTPVNMASLTASLFDAEFFGHTRGAFTGADREREGYLASTHHGTLFLDEIGNLSLELQGKLLRFLQGGEYMRLGSSRQEKADVRFIAATNEDLERLMGQKRFRRDLYYRIRGSWLQLPPLRERREDIPLLIRAFMKTDGPDGVFMEEEAVNALMSHDFPGNIRELRFIIQSAANLAQGKPVALRHLPDYLRRLKPGAARHKTTNGEPLGPLAQVVRTHTLRAYEATGRNKAKTAKLLGIGINTLRRKLESYGIRDG